MITPVNGNLVIDPLKHKTFLPSDNQTYQEIGIVRSKGKPCWWRWLFNGEFRRLNIGENVYFDSWLAGKFHDPKSEDDEDYYWIVSWKDVKGVE
jgi:hypothetical protein